MSAHARLSPSAATRWFTCPRSVLLIEQLIAEGRINPSRSSGAADEGTAAHQIRADCLDLGLDPWDFVGTSLTINGVSYPCDEEMAAYLQPGIDWVREQPGDLIVEHRVDLGHWMPGQFGTLDTAIIDRERRKAVTKDLKYGAGVPVSPVDSKQLQIYSLGVVENFNLWKVVDSFDIVIDQPRCGGMKFWSVNMDDLLAFGEELRVAAKRTEDPDAPLVASEEGCRFCPVKDLPEGCDAYTAWMLDIAGLDDLDDLTDEPKLPDPSKITPARRWYIVQHAHLVTKFLAKLHADSMEAAEAGTPDPGSKLVTGQRGNRKWRNPERAERIMKISLGDDAYTRKVIPLTQAEKALAPGRKKVGNARAWNLLNKLITQDDGRPILVPASDPRNAIPSLTAGLDDLDDL